jgi:hypothetical protein
LLLKGCTKRVIGDDPFTWWPPQQWHISAPAAAAFFGQSAAADGPTAAPWAFQ